MHGIQATAQFSQLRGRQLHVPMQAVLHVNALGKMSQALHQRILIEFISCVVKPSLS